MSQVAHRVDLLESLSFKCSVSSVLNKDVKQHGKQYMFDAEEDTAWNSNEGTPQWINLQFDEPQKISGFSFQFQGGFVGKDAKIVLTNSDGAVVSEEPFYPEDINSVQHFRLSVTDDKEVTKVKFIFGASTDFFGRIIVYKLKIY